MRILFISRKYPPVKGGMENYTKNLLDNLKVFYRVDTILLRKTQAHLLWFLPYSLVKSVFLVLKNRYDLVYMGDALLGPIGLILKYVAKIKTAVTVHGLDITYNNIIYRAIIPYSISKSDKVICVSRNTLKECKKRNIPSDICTFIPNGVNADEYILGNSKEEYAKNLKNKIGINLENKRILFTLGRLIKRKGVDWFIENVFTKLDGSFIYIVGGSGPQKKELDALINKLSLKDRVKLIGRVDYHTLKLLYNCADCFIIPNQKIKNNPEGFGIAAIEAASCGVPVIANSVDGVKDAVINGKTGWLIECNDVDAFIAKIKDPGLEREDINQANMIFSWSNIIKKYKEVIEAA